MTKYANISYTVATSQELSKRLGLRPVESGISVSFKMFRKIGTVLLFVPSMALVAPRAPLPRKCVTHAKPELVEEGLFSSRRAVLSTSAAAAAAWLAPSGAIAKSAPTDEALADLMANPGDVAEKVNTL